MKKRGFTLIELLIAIAIAAVLISLAAPSFSRMLAKQRARAAVGELYTDLQMARSEAVQRNTNVAVTLNTTAWCYVIHPSSAACDCTLTTDTCGAGNDAMVIKRVAGSDFSGTTLATPAGMSPLIYEPRQGLLSSATSGDLVVSGSTGTQVPEFKVQVNGAGRPKLCVVGAATSGVPSCS